jgi:uncharacterized Zn finger protein
MKAVIETTQWADGVETYNHVYLMDGDRCLAYIPHGTREIRRLAAPRRMDRRGRTFKELKFNPFGGIAPQSSVVRVAGSRGNTYDVDVDAGTCTCPGHTYHGHCRHVAQAQAT